MARNAWRGWFAHCSPRAEKSARAGDGVERDLEAARLLLDEAQYLGLDVSATREGLEMNVADEGSHRIRLVSRLSGTSEDAEVRWIELGDSDVCRVEMELGDDELAGEGDDFFDALVALRRQLEARDLLIVCYGASLNVYPSGMCRDMGRGMTGYKMRMGQKARLADIVTTFDAGSDVTPATVDEQEAFVEKWRASISRDVT